MARFNWSSEVEWRLLAESSDYKAGGIASRLGISRRQLQRYTRLAFGRSPQGWLDQERLVMALSMLRRTRSAKTTAYGTGFKQLSHFSREFKQFYGVSPTEFLAWDDRQRAQEQIQTHLSRPGSIRGEPSETRRELSAPDKHCPRGISA